MAFIPVSPVISSQGRTLKNGVSSLIGELPAPVFSRPEPLKEGRSMDLFWAAKTENSSFLQHILQCPRPGVSSKPKQELLELGGKAKNALAINLARFQYRSSDSVWMVKELHSVCSLHLLSSDPGLPGQGHRQHVRLPPASRLLHGPGARD